MGQEIEAKFRVDTHDNVRGRLQTSGATFIERVLETNHLLDRAGHLLRDQDCGLRVRTAIPDPESGNDAGLQSSIRPTSSPAASSLPAFAAASRRTTLTFKGPRKPGPLKSREEIETEVADADALLLVLERLGFQPVLVYQKRRESWELNGCRIELDQPPHIGLFVEIEGPDERRIRYVQARLELSNDCLVRKSYAHLLMDYCRTHAIPVERIEIER